MVLGVATLGSAGQAPGTQPLCGRCAKSLCARPARSMCGMPRLLLGLVLVADALAHAQLTLHHGADDRFADRRFVCGQLALHHGAGGHAFLWARGLFRSGRLRRGAAGAQLWACRWRWRCWWRPWSRLSGPWCLAGFAVRLSGVYLAMLTPWRLPKSPGHVTFQWDSFTGGSNGLTGVWPSACCSATSACITGSRLGLVAGWRAGGCGGFCFRRLAMRLRAGRDSVLRADAIGIDVKRLQWLAFVLAGGVAGLAGALYAFSKGSISPESHERGQVGGRPGDGFAGWHSNPGWPRGRCASASPGCTTWWRATPTTGAPCWAPSSCCWCCCFRRALPALAANAVAALAARAPHLRRGPHHERAAASEQPGQVLWRRQGGRRHQL